MARHASSEWDIGDSPSIGQAPSRERTMLEEVYQRLFDSFGPQHWWPAESRLEVMVGAILTQNTNWRNVEQAIQNLKQSRLLGWHQLRNIDVHQLAGEIRPAGTYRVKARRLKNLVEFIDRTYGDLDAMFATELDELRAGLLSVNGVGPETADSILLYAGNYPTFVSDAYTSRIVKRHDWIAPTATYEDLKTLFESALPRDAQLFNEFHALIVMTGKHYCGPTPQCESCPLRDMLPASGPVELRNHRQ